MKAGTKKSKPPSFFKPILWSYDFSKIDPEESMERIIVNTINYGDWQHWQWIVDYYGRNKVKRVIENTPVSEFRKGSLRLISLLLDIKKIKYVSRGAKIKAEKNIQKIS